MVPTHGLTHIALAVGDPERSLRFYQQVLGVVEIYREPGFIQVQTPGARDVIVFEKLPSKAGKSGGVAHFGFRLLRPGDIELAAREVERAGRHLHAGELVQLRGQPLGQRDAARANADQGQILDAAVALENLVRDARQAARDTVGIHYHRHARLECVDCVEQT